MSRAKQFECGCVQREGGSMVYCPKHLETPPADDQQLRLIPTAIPGYRMHLDGSETCIRLRATFTVCTRCSRSFPTQLRRMGTGIVRNQPQCGECRSRYG